MGKMEDTLQILKDIFIKLNNNLQSKKFKEITKFI